MKTNIKYSLVNDTHADVFMGNCRCLQFTLKWNMSKNDGQIDVIKYSRIL